MVLVGYKGRMFCGKIRILCCFFVYGGCNGMLVWRNKEYFCWYFEFGGLVLLGNDKRL